MMICKWIFSKIQNNNNKILKKTKINRKINKKQIKTKRYYKNRTKI